MSKGNPVAKGWDEAAASWVDFVRQGKDFFRDELNNPAMFKLIGDVRGKVVLDVCCGEGCNARILARKGAKVVGVDLSGVLIEYAKAQGRPSYRLLCCGFRVSFNVPRFPF